ncbi:M48 family metalloprotease [Egicoccus halophilus]|uniref:Peptidase M48 domain-containing protein n=1 Tax=Egicoccus halophilus TaxID=1670830 RepID=A0A8J3A987_9ACTN|nr:M48 family metalloprotease [Egicoccus halophilus]GGI07261.1 hypothetical protein GCM10011354_23200 [Egicoccus halophilus]
MWALAAVGLAALGLAASVWRPLAPAVPATTGQLATFGDGVLTAVAAYRAPRYVVSAIATVLGIAVPLGFVATRWGRERVRVWAGDAAGPWRAGLVALRLSILGSLAVLPLAVYSGVLHEGRWGFRTRSVPGWLLDWGVRAGSRWLGIAVLVVLLFAVVRRWPDSWPFRATVGGTLLVAGAVLLHPVVVQPWTLPSVPLAAGPAADAMADVLDRAGDPPVDVRVGEASRRTTRVNALVTGLGPTQRVVVYDNLLELPPAQVASVFAHELAHQEHADLTRGVALSGAALLTALVLLRFVLSSRRLQRAAGADAPGDGRMVAVVLLAAAVLELVGTPIGNAVSRRAEAAADARAVELTRDPALLLSTTRVFTVRDLASPTPPRWVRLLHGTHPTVTERITYLEGWAEREGIELPTLAELERAEEDQHHPAVSDAPPREPGGARP